MGLQNERGLRGGDPISKHGESTEAMHSLERCQAATLGAVRTEIARLQRTEYLLYAILENLAKTILTYMPVLAAENKVSRLRSAKLLMSTI
jgi:hypothetical protein